jgi:hypothetical protein
MRASTLAVTLCLGLTACGQPPPNPRGVDRGEVLVQISASGRTDTRPDEARFTAGVSTIAPAASAASAANNQAMNRVVAALRGLGIRAEDVQTRSITLVRIEEGPNRGRFEAGNQVEVRVRDLAKAGQAIAAATEAGANVLSGPNLALANPEAADRAAYAQAFRAARARAEAYAQAAGLRVDRVLAIRDTGAQGPPIGGYELEMMADMAQAAEPPPVMAGQNSSEVRIRVDFALAPQ